MADRTETSASAVRDAAHLIAAAEEILALAPDPEEAATYIGTVADAAKALRANHLADALEHVRYRADRIADARRTFGWANISFAPDGWPDPDASEHDARWDNQDGPSEPEAEGRAARHEAAVDELVGDPGEPQPDPEALRARVHGDDDG